MSLRTGCLAILVGLLAAVGLFAWSEAQAGRPPLDLIGVATPTSSPRPSSVPATATSASAAPRPPGPTPTPLPLPTRTAAPATASPRPTPSATTRPAAPAAVPPGAPTPGARQVGISFDDLDRELRQALPAGGAPLRNPRLRFLPPDRVGLQGSVPIAIFEVPVEIEARLSVDDQGRVRVTTSRVEAVGASLPESVTAELGRRVDDQGTRAIADALPPGSVARQIVVEPDRIRVELAS